MKKKIAILTGAGLAIALSTSKFLSSLFTQKECDECYEECDECFRCSHQCDENCETEEYDEYEDGMYEEYKCPRNYFIEDNCQSDYEDGSSYEDYR